VRNWLISQPRLLDRLVSTDGPAAAGCRYAVLIILMTCVVVLMTSVALAQPASPAAAPPEGDPSDEMEAVARGPLHEAFAEVHGKDPKPGILVEREPPEPIEEVPPEHKPEGEDVVWIPGYWAWDVDREDFLWISGVWRKVPSGRSWVPGYWSEAEGSWRWVSGFWSDAEAEELEYLPAPPESIEVGPSSPAPDDTVSYVPGHWEYVDDGYRWHAGYWQPVREDLVWIPGRYVWTPRGCIYRPGYWDFLPSHRGTLFAPVYFHAAVYLQPSYRFTPYYVVEVGPSFLIHLFVRPGYCHYYFGDYYADHYRQYDIFPWVHAWGHHRHYDPLHALYSQYSRHHTTLTRVRGWHSYFHKHKDHRPVHTFAAGRRTGGHGGDIGRMARLGGAYDDLVRRGDRRHEFVRVERGPWKQFRDRSAGLREFSRLRAALETAETAAHASGERSKGGGDKILQFLREHEAAQTRPRPDSDRPRFQSQGDGERTRAKWGRSSWRSGEEPDRTPRGVQTDADSPATKRERMAEFLQQRRPRSRQQPENTLTRPKSGSHSRQSEAGANERPARPGWDHLRDKSGRGALGPRTTPQPDTPSAPSNGNAMIEFLKRQQARIERQAAPAASRPSPASRSPQPAARSSTRSSSRSPQPPSRRAERSESGAKSALSDLLGRRSAQSGAHADSRRSLPRARAGSPPAIGRDSSRSAAAHAQPSRPPTPGGRSGRTSREASPRRRAASKLGSARAAFRAAKQSLGRNASRSKKREKPE
ncbi:MAG: hypothetical protein ACQESR_31405, partial [Planctomycetota bacterium]